MLTVTEGAAARLAEILAAENCPTDIAIRFVFDGRDLAMQADNQRPGDATFEHAGRVVLLLDEEVAQLLENQILDLDGGRLVLRATPITP